VDAIASLLDRVPLATIVSIAGIIGAIIALANGSIDFQAFLVSIGAVTGGAGVLGVARNQAGRGVK